MQAVGKRQGAAPAGPGCLLSAPSARITLTDKSKDDAAVFGGKMGVVSVGGMRLKARNDRPRLPGTYPPPPDPRQVREEIVIGYRRGQGDSCGEWGEGVFARASIDYMAVGWGDRARLWNPRGL